MKRASFKVTVPGVTLAEALKIRGIDDDLTGEVVDGTFVGEFNGEVRNASTEFAVWQEFAEDIAHELGRPVAVQFNDGETFQVKPD